MAVSFHIKGSTQFVSRHAISQQNSYIAPASTGDHTADLDGSAFTEAGPSWYLIEGLDVMSEPNTKVIAAFGDSITDGFVSAYGIPVLPNLSDKVYDRNVRYPDLLAQRISENKFQRASVINAGISGNRLLEPGLVWMVGPSGMSRVKTDLIDVPGVTDVILGLGTNDLGIPPLATADKLIAGYTELIAQLKAAGIRTYLATQPPSSAQFLIAFHGAPAQIAERNKFNQWVRNQKISTGIVDFAAAVADPSNTDRLDSKFDSGDQLHPNPVGYKAMADAIDLDSILQK